MGYPCRSRPGGASRSYGMSFARELSSCWSPQLSLYVCHLRTGRGFGFVHDADEPTPSHVEFDRRFRDWRSRFRRSPIERAACSSRRRSARRVSLPSTYRTWRAPRRSVRSRGAATGTSSASRRDAVASGRCCAVIRVASATRRWMQPVKGAFQCPQNWQHARILAAALRSQSLQFPVRLPRPAIKSACASDTA